MSYNPDPDQASAGAREAEYEVLVSPVGWLCPCGRDNGHDYHCDECKTQPPWGCDCPACGGTWDDGEEDCEDFQWP